MKWKPIESSPEILTKYAHELGMKKELEFIDLYTFDPSTAVEFGIPIEDCKAMILLFPLSERDQLADPIEETTKKAYTVKFIRQTIENACGLMALLHILLNEPSLLLEDSSSSSELLLQQYKDKFEDNTADPISLSKVLEDTPAFAQLHSRFADLGQQDQQDEDVEAEEVPFHYISIIKDPKNDSIWVLDGRKTHPKQFPNQNRNQSSNTTTTTSDFFKTACQIVHQEFVQNSADQTNFSALILI